MSKQPPPPDDGSSVESVRRFFLANGLPWSPSVERTLVDDGYDAVELLKFMEAREWDALFAGEKEARRRLARHVLERLKREEVDTSNCAEDFHARESVETSQNQHRGERVVAAMAEAKVVAEAEQMARKQPKFEWHAQQSNKSDRSWQKNFDSYVAHLRRNGAGGNLAWRDNPKLCDWIRRQKNEYQLKSLDEVRMKMLREVGFDFNASNKWQTCFERLSQHVRENGCLPKSVNTTDATNRRWWTQQLKRRERGDLSEEQVECMNEIETLLQQLEQKPHQKHYDEVEADDGGDAVNAKNSGSRKRMASPLAQIADPDPADVIMNEDEFGKYVVDLLAFRAEHGAHCTPALTPSARGNMLHNFTERDLHLWIWRMSEARLKLGRGDPTTLTPAHVAILNQVGFPWTGSRGGQNAVPSLFRQNEQSASGKDVAGNFEHNMASDIAPWHVGFGSSGGNRNNKDSSSIDGEHYDHDGTWRRVPPGWNFPHLTLRNMYLYWHCGDDQSEQKVSPMKTFTSKDVAHLGRRDQINLTNVRFLMECIDKIATKKGRPPKSSTMTRVEANACFLVGEAGIEMDATTPTGRLRNKYTLTWSSVLRLMKNNRKRRRKS